MTDRPAAAFQTVNARTSNITDAVHSQCTQRMSYIYYNYYSTVSVYTAAAAAAAKTRDWLPPSDHSHDSNTIFN